MLHIFSNTNSRISIFVRNFERSFTPGTKLGSARNFGKTRFRRFAIFHFSTLKTFFWIFFLRKFSDFSKKVRFWRSYDFLIRVGRCVGPSHCPKCPYFWGDFLGGGVNDSICVENVDLAWKMTSTIWCLRFGDNMIIWYHDWNTRGVTTFSVYLCVLSKMLKKLTFLGPSPPGDIFESPLCDTRVNY